MQTLPLYQADPTNFNPVCAAELVRRHRARLVRVLPGPGRRPERRRRRSRVAPTPTTAAQVQGHPSGEIKLERI